MEEKKINSQELQESFKKVYKKAGIMVISVGLLLFSILFMFLPWFEISVGSLFGDDYASLFDDVDGVGSEETSETFTMFESAGILDIVILAVTVAVLGYILMGLFKVYSGSKLSKKQKVNLFSAAGVASLVNFLAAGIIILAENEEYFDVKYGFYLYMGTMLVILALNGYQMYLNKEDVKLLFGKIKDNAQDKLEAVQKQAKEASEKAKSEVKDDSSESK